MRQLCQDVLAALRASPRNEATVGQLCHQVFKITGHFKPISEVYEACCELRGKGEIETYADKGQHTLLWINAPIEDVTDAEMDALTTPRKPGALR
jgi:hypothetical protein